MAIQTSTVQLKVGERSAAAYLARPDVGGPGVLLLHAWWGLKPFFKQSCDRLAEQGLLVLAPDLRQGQVANTVDEAQDLMSRSDSQLTADIVVAAMDYLAGLSGRKGNRFGVIGFSMGAQWALFAAAHKPEQVGAVVMFYGLGDADPARLQAAVLGHFSDIDEWEPYDYTQKLEKQMKAAGVDVEFHVYPGKAHWFVEEDRPEYDAQAAKLAWDRTFKFLKEHL
jgi:carboxymethylenebutenolidase